MYVLLFYLAYICLEAIFQQTYTLSNTNHFSPQQLTFVHSLSKEDLLAAANRAYLKLEKEILTLRDRVDNLQCVAS
jgi:hypothetical protein